VENIDKNLELALLIKDKKSPHPLSILSIVPNDQEAEINILKSKIKLEQYVRQGSASEMKVNVITTIDHNAMSGISRTSREVMADIILLGWPKEMGFIEKIMGEKLDIVLSNVDKTIIFAHFEAPLIAHKRIIVLAPPMCEIEKGFITWMTKLAKLNQELSLEMVFYCNDKTKESIMVFLSKSNSGNNVHFKYFEEWQDILILARDIKNEDLIVLINARKGTLSYQNDVENILSKLEKHFENNSKIMVYPKQQDYSQSSENYEDLSAGPLAKGLETLGKGLESIFKGK